MRVSINFERVMFLFYVIQKEQIKKLEKGLFLYAVECGDGEPCQIYYSNGLLFFLNYNLMLYTSS